jgi:Fe-S-cluster containining protein
MRRVTIPNLSLPRNQAGGSRPATNTPPVKPAMPRSRFVTSLDKIRDLAAEQRRENRQFRQFLKRGRAGSPEEVDALVNQAFAEVSAAVDCTECANCCSICQITVLPDEAEPLARHAGLTVHTFRRRHVVKGDEPGERLMAGLPCIFLEDKLCSIYVDRPVACRDYPNLHTDGFIERSEWILQHIPICPIIYNVYQLLKKRTGFKPSQPKPKA